MIRALAVVLTSSLIILSTSAAEALERDCVTPLAQHLGREPTYWQKWEEGRLCGESVVPPESIVGGKGCQCAPFAGTTPRAALENYVRGLDLWIVSSGGVGSNALGEFLSTQGIRSGFARGTARADYRLYVQTCHPPFQFVANAPPILFLYGDLRNALHSVLRQQYVYYNMEKLHWGTNGICQFDPGSLKGLLEAGDPDPVGVAAQLLEFASVTDDTPIVFLK